MGAQAVDALQSVPRRLLLDLIQLLVRCQRWYYDKRLRIADVGEMRCQHHTATTTTGKTKAKAEAGTAGEKCTARRDEYLALVPQSAYCGSKVNRRCTKRTNAALMLCFWHSVCFRCESSACLSTRQAYRVGY
jgi:hypothetical protein